MSTDSGASTEKRQASVQIVIGAALLAVMLIPLFSDHDGVARVAYAVVLVGALMICAVGIYRLSVARRRR